MGFNSAPDDSQEFIPRSNIDQKKIMERAQGLFDGTLSLSEIARDYPPYIVQQIIQANNDLEEHQGKQTPESPQPHEGQVRLEKQDELLEAFDTIIQNYQKPNRTEVEEDAYLNLLNFLKEDKQFSDILDQYKELINANPEETETYELKALKDFRELYEATMQE